jgi:hypothetical protein
VLEDVLDVAGEEATVLSTEGGPQALAHDGVADASSDAPPTRRSNMRRRSARPATRARWCRRGRARRRWRRPASCCRSRPADTSGTSRPLPSRPATPSRAVRAGASTSSPCHTLSMRAVSASASVTCASPVF